MQTKVTKTMYYRRATFIDGSAQDMESLVEQALSSLTKVKDRLEVIGSAAQQHRLICMYTVADPFLFGTLATFERGRYQPVIDDNEDANSLVLDAIRPPKKDGQIPRQFVPGLLYFAILKNHVAILQSTSLRISALEEHLAWLLRDRARLLNNTQGFVLKDEPQKATINRIRKAHVKSVMIARPLFDTLGQAEQDLKTSRFKPAKSALGLLRFLLDKDQIEELDLKSGVFDGNLEVWIEVRYPRYQRNQPEDSIQILDDLGVALRNNGDNETRLKLTDGSIVQGSELRISETVAVEIKTNGLPDEHALYDQLKNWLRDLLKRGTINAD